MKKKVCLAFMLLALCGSVTACSVLPFLRNKEQETEESSRKKKKKTARTEEESTTEESNKGDEKGKVENILEKLHVQVQTHNIIPFYESEQGSVAELSYDVLLVEDSYPALQSSLQKISNFHVEDFRDRVRQMQEAQADAEAAYAHYASGTYALIGYPLRADSRIFSFSLSYDSYFYLDNGNHDLNRSLAYVLDTEDGSILQPADVVKEEDMEAFLAVFEKDLQRQMKAEHSDSMPSEGSLFIREDAATELRRLFRDGTVTDPDTLSWAMSGSGVYLYIAPHTLSDFPNRSLCLSASYDELEGIIKEEYLPSGDFIEKLRPGNSYYLPRKNGEDRRLFLYAEYSEYLMSSGDSIEGTLYMELEDAVFSVPTKAFDIDFYLVHQQDKNFLLATLHLWEGYADTYVYDLNGEEIRESFSIDGALHMPTEGIYESISDTESVLTANWSMEPDSIFIKSLYFIFQDDDFYNEYLLHEDGSLEAKDNWFLATPFTASAKIRVKEDTPAFFVDEDGIETEETVIKKDSILYLQGCNFNDRLGFMTEDGTLLVCPAVFAEAGLSLGDGATDIDEVFELVWED